MNNLSKFFSLLVLFVFSLNNLSFGQLLQKTSYHQENAPGVIYFNSEIEASEYIASINGDIVWDSGIITVSLVSWTSSPISVPDAWQVIVVRLSGGSAFPVVEYNYAENNIKWQIQATQMGSNHGPIKYGSGNLKVVIKSSNLQIPVECQVIVLEK